MKKNLLGTFFLLLTTFVFSQSKIIGKVVYLNSGKKPAVGVEITAEGSSGDYSKSDGAYTLNFPSKNPGTTVYPKIGDELVLNVKRLKKIELVNIEKLNGVNIPINASSSPLKIVVCPKGYRDFAAKKYYKILKTQADFLLSKKREELVALKEKLDASNSIVIKLENELKLYQAQVQDTVVIYKEALSIASINKDDANQRIKDYLEALGAGVNVETARKILSTEDAYKEALKSKTQIDFSIEEIDRDAKSLISLFKYENALQKYDTISLLLKNKIFNPLKLVNHLKGLGVFCRDIHYDKKALNYYYEALRVMEEEQMNVLIKSDLLNEIGTTHMLISEYQKAENSFSESLNVLKRLTKRDSLKYALPLARAYGKLGMFYTYTYEYQNAESAYDNAINLYEFLESENYHSEIVDINTMLIFNNLNDFSTNLDLETLCLETIKLATSLKIDERSKQLKMAFTKAILFMYYKHEEETEKAKLILQEVELIYKKHIKKEWFYNIDSNNIETNSKWIYLNAQRKRMYHFFNYVMTHSKENANNKDVVAIEYPKGQLQESANLLKSLAEYNPSRYNKDLAEKLFQEGIISVENEDYQTAITLLKEAKKIYELIHELNPDFLIYKIANINALIAASYGEINDYQNAENYFLKALSYSNKLIKKSLKNHFFLAETYLSLAYVYYMTDEVEKEIEMYSKALLHYNLLGVDMKKKHLEGILNTYYELSDMYIDAEENQKAIKIGLEAVEMYKSLNISTSNMYDTEIADIYQNLGEAYKKEKDYKNAEISYLNTLKIYEELNKIEFGNYYNEIGLAQFSISNIYLITEQIEKKNFMDKKALITYKILSKKNPKKHNNNVAFLNKTLGFSYKYMKQYIKSEKAYLEALKGYESLVETNPKKYNTYIAEINLSLGFLYLKGSVKNKDKSLYYTNKALKFYNSQDVKDKYILSNIKQLNSIIEYWRNK